MPSARSRRNCTPTTERCVRTGSSICFLRDEFLSGKTTVAPASRQRMRMENPLTWFNGSESNQAQPGRSAIISAAPKAFAIWDSKSCHTARGSPVEPDVNRSVPAEPPLIGKDCGAKRKKPSTFHKPSAPIPSARLSASASGRRGLSGASKQSRASSASNSVAWEKLSAAQVANGLAISKEKPANREFKKLSNSEYRTECPLTRSSKARESPKSAALEKMEL